MGSPIHPFTQVIYHDQRIFFGDSGFRGHGLSQFCEVYPFAFKAIIKPEVDAFSCHHFLNYWWNVRHSHRGLSFQLKNSHSGGLLFGYQN